MRTVRTQARPLWTGAARAAPVVAAALLIVAALPGPTAMAIYAEPSVVEQDYGPYTCLDGFVWREAVANDVVCVTAAVRAQTRQDNSLAAARRNPNGGPWGPDTCLQGYVWREAVTNDRVCVTPATREQARSDNAATDSRRNDVRTTLYTYSGGTRYTVRADRINTGRAYVGLYRLPSRAAIRGWRVNVPPHPSAPGGYLSIRTGVPRCTGGANAYFRVQDPASTRWGSRRYVCTTL